MTEKSDAAKKYDILKSPQNEAQTNAQPIQKGIFKPTGSLFIEAFYALC